MSDNGKGDREPKRATTGKAQSAEANGTSGQTGAEPYDSGDAYIGDLLRGLDLRIALLLHLQEALEEEAERNTAGNGSGSSAAMRLFSSERHSQRAAAARADTRTAELRDRLAAHERLTADRLEASADAGLALPYLIELFGLSPFEAFCVAVALAVEADRKYEAAFELLQGGEGKWPTPDLMAALAGVAGERPDPAAVRAAFDPGGALRKYFVRKPDRSAKPTTLLSEPIRLDERIVRFVLQSVGLPSAMAGYAELLAPDPPGPERELPGNADLQRKLRAWLSARTGRAGLPLLVSLWGRRGSGKKTHIRRLCAHYGEPLLLVDMAKLATAGADVPALMAGVYREATIQRALLVLDRFEAVMPVGNEPGAAADILDELAALPVAAILLSDRSCGPIDRKRRLELELEIAPLTDDERALMWRKLAAAYPTEPELDWEALSARFLFNPGEMIGALDTARTLAEWNAEGREAAAVGWREMIQAGYRQLQHNLAAKSKRLSPKNGWDELILPAAQKTKLQHACNHIRYKHTVYGHWGFNRKLSYGTGISLLFSGPPGTGKTMASEIVAKELDMEVYKIDLSQIISKYIGETEKNLREIFDEAQVGYAVLFFDEADALFGKRSEVKDAHDKNANTEVAFLLQKMEEYRGISILATNYLQNMDEAFLRRINYVIRFPFPEEKQREQIWRTIFPAETPVEPELDYGFLARKLPVAGGSIKNIALTAAFLAGGRRESIGMKHVFKAYQYELDKTNRGLTKDDLAEYDDLYPYLTDD